MAMREDQPTAEQFVEMSPEEIRHYLDSGKTPPELSDSQLKQLPASLLEPYIYAREASGDVGVFGRVMASISSRVEASNILEQKQRMLSSHDIEYRGGLPSSDSNYLGIDHQKLKSDTESISAEGITVYSDNYHKIHQLFSELSEQLNSAINKSKQGWEGDAADSAHGYFASLATWAEGNSVNADMASQIIAAEADAASTAKNSMPEPIPFDLEKEMESWGSNPLTTIEQISKTFEKWEESRAAHEQAAEVMHRYDAELQEAGNKQPVFAEPPSFGGGSAESSVKPSGVIQVPDTSATGGGTKASGYAGVPGGSVSPSTGGGGYGGGGLGAPSPTPPPGGGPSTGAGVVPPVTRPSGLNPGGGMTRPPAGGRGSQRSGFGPGGMGAVPAAGLAGGFGPGGGGGGGSYGGGRVPGAGFGPGGGAGGAGGAGAGSGAATGARPMGGPAAAGPGAAAAAAGAAGRGGMGAAPMGAGAGAGKGGQGGEDNEHQRPTYLVEADPDDVFGTDQRTAPPVIGA